jgi:NAD(P) transhydrogenase subunit beta
MAVDNESPSEGLFVACLIAAALLGNFFVLPIGGADMPVVISLLNAFTGLAAAAAGFSLDNTALIVGGTLVGSSGTILTMEMATAMNRSVANILFAGFGGAPAAGAGAGEERPHRSIGPQDAAIALAYADSVVIVPGYGLAVAQAQHAVAEMDDINPDMPRTDVAVVIGANDVTNPAAKDDPDSPIAGMPIIETHEAGQVIVIKRSMSPGFAGIDNDLFYMDKTAMLFMDAKSAAQEITSEITEL